MGPSLLLSRLGALKGLDVSGKKAPLRLHLPGPVSSVTLRPGIPRAAARVGARSVASPQEVLLRSHVVSQPCGLT